MHCTGRAFIGGNIFSDLCRNFFQLFNHGGVLFCQVGFFADFFFQIVEAAALGQIRIALANAHAKGLPGESQFPWTLPHGLQLGAAEIMPGLTRGCFGFTEHPLRHIHAINFDFLFNFATGQ